MFLVIPHTRQEKDHPRREATRDGARVRWAGVFLRIASLVATSKRTCGRGARRAAPTASFDHRNAPTTIRRQPTQVRPWHAHDDRSTGHESAHLSLRVTSHICRARHPRTLYNGLAIVTVGEVTSFKSSSFSGARALNGPGRLLNTFGSAGCRRKAVASSARKTSR